MNKLPFFHKGESGKIHFTGQRKLTSQFFLYLYICLILILFLLLILRLFQLTIVKGDYYRRLSEENRIRELLIESRRGKIIDRKGFVIAENKKADVEKNMARLTSPQPYFSAESFPHPFCY